MMTPEKERELFEDMQESITFERAHKAHLEHSDKKRRKSAIIGLLSRFGISHKRK